MANNNSNALAEIQSKYQNCNLLVPAATSVQINPFYKRSVMEVVADTSERSGDIFSVQEQIQNLQEQNQSLQELNSELQEQLQILPGTEDMLELLEKQDGKIQELETENRQWKELAERLNNENGLLQKQTVICTLGR